MGMSPDLSKTPTSVPVQGHMEVPVPIRVGGAGRGRGDGDRAGGSEGDGLQSSTYYSTADSVAVAKA